MSASKSSLGIHLALEDAASPELPFGIAMAMAHQVSRQISGQWAGKSQRFTIKNLNGLSWPLVLEIIFIWAKETLSNTEVCHHGLQCNSWMHEFYDFLARQYLHCQLRSCSNVFQLPHKPGHSRWLLLIQVIRKWRCRLVLSKLWAHSDEESFIAAVHLDSSVGKYNDSRFINREHFHKIPPLEMDWSCNNYSFISWHWQEKSFLWALILPTPQVSMAQVRAPVPLQHGFWPSRRSLGVWDWTLYIQLWFDHPYRIMLRSNNLRVQSWRGSEVLSKIAKICEDSCVVTGGSAMIIPSHPCPNLPLRTPRTCTPGLDTRL